jgi:hypothetical protein
MMSQHSETIRITACERDLLIAIEGEAGERLLDINTPRNTLERQPSLDALDVIPADDPDEYVISFEFDSDLWNGHRRVSLERLEVHVRDIKIRLRDEGYVLEGILSGWVGYTNAR